MARIPPQEDPLIKKLSRFFNLFVALIALMIFLFVVIIFVIIDLAYRNWG